MSRIKFSEDYLGSTNFQTLYILGIGFTMNLLSIRLISLLFL